MQHRDLLTENEVIQGVENFLRQKGRTSHIGKPEEEWQLVFH